MNDSYPFYYRYWSEVYVFGAQWWNIKVGSNLANLVTGKPIIPGSMFI